MSGNLVRFPNVRPSYVLDTWPMMEWLKGREPAAQALRLLIERGERREVRLRMSVINLGEVYYSSSIVWGQNQADEIFSSVLKLPIVYAAASRTEVLSAARLKAAYQVSYTDGFAASLAIRFKCPLVTGDPDFLKLQSSGVLQLEWIGK